MNTAHTHKMRIRNILYRQQVVVYVYNIQKYAIHINYKIQINKNSYIFIYQSKCFVKALR